MSVGAVRSPTRLLSQANVAMAFPGELLIDPATGNFLYINDSMGQVAHKKPGTLTVKQGSSTLLNAGDLSEALEFTIPSASWDDIKPTNIPANMVNGLTASRALVSDANGVLSASTITTTQLGYLANVTSDIQTQLNGKAASDHTHSNYLSTTGGAISGAITPAANGTIDLGSASAAFRSIYAGTFVGNLQGNATSATTATTATSATTAQTATSATTAGSAATLTTARTITIGNTGKSFDGSANISFSLREIGAAAANHTHSGYLGASGGTVTGTLTISGTLSVTGKATGIQKVYSGTLSTSWSGSKAPYTQAVTVSGILATDRPIVDYTNSGTYATDQSREEGWLNIYRAVTAANKITFYAHEKPKVSIPFTAQVVR